MIAKKSTVVLILGLLAAGWVGPRGAAAQMDRTIEAGSRPGGAGAVIPVSDLPLHLVPAPDGHVLAVMLTGDGGWAAGDQGLAASFARHNVAVAGLSSPMYLEQKRTPDEAAHDLTRIVRHFLEAWHRDRVVIVGYSRGADIAPFMISRLPADLRERVDLTVLLGPGEWASFKFGLLDLLFFHHGRDDRPVQAEVAKLRGTPVLCIYGAKDRGSICPSLGEAGLARLIVRTGGHVVGRSEGPALVDAILATAGLGSAAPSGHDDAD